MLTFLEWERARTAYSTFALAVAVAGDGDDVTSGVARLCELDGSCSVLLHRLQGDGRTLRLDGAWNCEAPVRVGYEEVPVAGGLLPICDAIEHATVIRAPIRTILDVYPTAGALLWDLPASDYDIFDLSAVPLTVDGVCMGGLTIVSNWDSAVTDDDVAAFDAVPQRWVTLAG